MLVKYMAGKHHSQHWCTLHTYILHVSTYILHVSTYKSTRALQRGSLGLLCPASRHSIDLAVFVEGEVDPAPFQSFWAAPGTEQRSRSSQRWLRPTYALTLVDRIVLRAAKAANCRFFGLGFGGGDGWRRLRGLRGPGRVVYRRYRSVEEQSEAVSVGV